jgi:FtsZ-binding cell division protein ZapB
MRPNMAKQATARTMDLDPIDRLEEKIKMLVDMVTRLRGEQADAAADNARLVEEVEMLRARIAGAQGAQAELDALRGEREAIRNRVSEMLSQLDSI